MTKESHNPQFNRWFSAIYCDITLKELHCSHNPYFNRWFSAIINNIDGFFELLTGHNPYFNRWFSAIKKYDV